MFAVKPVKLIEPVVEPQFVGLVKLVPVITGVGFITTGTLVAADTQFPGLRVAVTTYIPLIAVVTFNIDGFCTALVNELGPVQL